MAEKRVPRGLSPCLPKPSGRTTALPTCQLDRGEQTLVLQPGHQRPPRPSSEALTFPGSLPAPRRANAHS